MDLMIDRDSRVPIFRQIAAQLRELIVAGKLPPGFRLPPERRLAEALGVNRSTVLSAYHELRSDAFIDAHVGRGTTVLPQRYRAADRAGTPSLSWRQLFRSAPERTQDPLLRDLLALTERRDGISLSVGLPAPELVPVAALREALDEVLGEAGPAALLHCPTEGHTPLRETLAHAMTTRGIRCSAAELLVVSGSQQGLDLAARVLVDPGDAVVVEEPTFFGALEVFRGAGARLLGVPTDQHGMRTDALSSLLERHRAKLIYTLPTFQNPSGATLPLERRRHLLELAYRFGVPILEDDPYSELRYEGAPLPPLAALDEHAHVLYLSTFSKVLFPGLRLGWMVAPRAVLRRLVLAKQAMDLHSNTVGQWLLDRFLRRGGWAPHVRKVRAAYRSRRDAMDEALRSGGPAGLEWQKPDGGFYVWCRMPEGIDPGRLLARAAETGVSFLPGGPCFAGEAPGHFLRLNFSFPSAADIREGVARLLGAARDLAGRPAGKETETEATRPIV